MEYLWVKNLYVGVETRVNLVLRMKSDSKDSLYTTTYQVGLNISVKDNQDKKLIFQINDIK